MRVDDGDDTRQFRRFERFVAKILDNTTEKADGRMHQHPPIQPIGPLRRFEERLKSPGDKALCHFFRSF